MSERFVVLPTRTIAGTVRVPGDKSISHRALMLGAIADGRTDVHGFLPGDDCLATLAAIRALGISVVRHDETSVSIEGRGMHGLQAPAGPLDMGNSGTAMRLFAGLLAGQPFGVTLTGDESLCRRPMERVAAPLRQMGADIVTSKGCPPLLIRGGRHLHGIRYAMPVASAQVKSALLLAGLYAEGETSVSEPAMTRDHTERMLRAFGCNVGRDGATVRLNGGARLSAAAIDVPGDLSSAAFLIIAACLAESGDLVIENVGLNPSRAGILDILRLMGAEIEVRAASNSSPEPIGSIRVRPSALRGAAIPPGLVPLAIDEFPLVFMAAALATGETIVSGAAELRHKESDRIRSMVDGLRTLGIDADELPDGARIRGGTLHGGTVDSLGDHRVAMSFAVGATRADGPVTILDTANVRTSYPGFVGQARAIGMAIEEAH
jgi:3-phosphoshikimate 1-carboxyvinyltransferase